MRIKPHLNGALLYVCQIFLTSRFQPKPSHFVSLHDTFRFCDYIYVEVGETSREDGTEAVVPENLIYNWSEDHNALNLTTDLGGKTLHWSALVAKLNSEDKLEILGTFSRFTFTGSTSLVKTAAAASTKSVRSSNSFEDVKSLLPAGPLKYIR